jgi:protein-disulfide isomerase
MALQGADRAWKFHDEVFAEQESLEKGGLAALRKIAAKHAADPKKLESDAASPAVKARIETDVAEAQKFGFDGTPTFLINGETLEGAQPSEEFARVIDRHLGHKK